MVANAPEAAPQQRASTYLRQQILSGRFPAGMRLKTEELAEVLGISRMPVRDALQQLHSEGLVEIRPNRGAVVTSLTPADVQELFEIRAALESLAARHACTALQAADFRLLEDLVAAMERVSADKAAWLDLHERFHETILASCGKPRLLQQIRHGRQALTPYIRMYTAVYAAVEMQDAEHVLLLRLARRGNPELFEAAVRDHVLSAAGGVVSFLTRNAGGTYAAAAQ